MTGADHPFRGSDRDDEPDAFDVTDEDGEADALDALDALDEGEEGEGGEERATGTDPFAELGDGVDGGEDTSSSVDSESGGFLSQTASGEADADHRDPFDKLDSVGDAADGPADAFERMDVSGAAEEDVWESLDDDAGDAAGASVGGPASAIADATAAEHVVDKRTYCQQCPHFTDPPEVACTHEGTAIVEVIGFGEFRVRNCPMVSEDDPSLDADE